MQLDNEINQKWYKTGLFIKIHLKNICQTLYYSSIDLSSQGKKNIADK